MRIRQHGRSRRNQRFPFWKKLLGIRPPQKPKRSWFKILQILAFLGGGSFILFSIIYSTYFLPDVRNGNLEFAESTIIYDRGALEKTKTNPKADLTENILYVIHGDENREFVPLEEISPWIKKATIAIEDDKFYSHFGIDLPAFTKAILSQLGIGPARGGSTITQQLVKNSFLSREQTYTRKYKEALLSFKMEYHFTKDEILELYLNKIPYGSNAHGVEAAARTFFGKSARDLSLAESAILASLPNRPTFFSPLGPNKKYLMGFDSTNTETGRAAYHKGRKDLVLQRMLDLEMITFDQFKTAVAQSKNMEFKTTVSDIKSPHFVFFVRQKIEEKYGKEFLKNGGLRIFTTLDPDLQEIAETVVKEKTENYIQNHGAENAALAAINPDNGEILSYIGNRDYFDSEHDGQFDVLSSAFRQPGSSFKPLVFAAAFEKGFSPATVLFDVETDFGGNYQPQNYDGKFVGPIRAREALNRSLNIPSVKMAFLAGVDEIFGLAQKLGIEIQGTPQDHGVALGVGVAEVRPLSHISSFQVFAGDGSWYEPSAILEIRDSAGEILESTDTSKLKNEGLDAEVVAMVRHILTDASTRPTTDDFDWNRLLQIDGFNNGAKTGTSNRRAKNPDYDDTIPDSFENSPTLTLPGDSWTIGFTPHLVTGVWVGNNKGKPMKSGATGLAVAAPIWHDFMRDAHASLVEKGADPKKEYNEPIPLTPKKINKYSGNIATEKTPEKIIVEEYFASFSIPTQIDNAVELVDFDKLSGNIATDITPQYARVQKEVLKLTSIRPDLPNWENPVQDWINNHPRFVSSFGEILDEGPIEIEEPLSVLDTPQAKDPIRRNQYTTQNPPKINIITPRDKGSIATGKINISVAITSKFGVRSVEYYLDDKLISTASEFPFTGTIEIPSDLTIGSKHILRATAIDRLFNHGSAESIVTILPDTKGPEIRFLGPVPKQKIPLGSSVTALLEVKDFASGVKVVEFLWNGESLGFDQSYPYETQFTAGPETGTQKFTARAWDFHGNVTEKTIPIQIERARLISTNEPEIAKITPYRSSVTVDVNIPKADTFDRIELIVEQKGETIAKHTIANPGSNAQIQILKNLQGKARLSLYAYPKSGEKAIKGTVRFIEL